MDIHQHQPMVLDSISTMKCHHLLVSVRGEEEDQLDETMCSIDSSRTPYTFIHTTKRADANIDVKLENMELWKRFAELNLEMIITKTGR